MTKRTMSFESIRKTSSKDIMIRLYCLPMKPAANSVLINYLKFADNNEGTNIVRMSNSLVLIEL